MSNSISNSSVDKKPAASPKICNVVAPYTLPEGTTFEAEVDGIKFPVTVPEGGVAKDEVFIVPYPTQFTTNGIIEPTAVAATAVEPTAVSATAVVSTVQVIAPSTMKGGSEFEAQLENGIKFMVTVPNGGVNKGDLITVPYPTNDVISNGCSGDGRTNNVVNDDNTLFEVPTGQWRTDICDCCGVGNDCCLCLMGFFCAEVVMAQVMQRMKYNFGGVPASNDGYQNVCIVITIVTLCIAFIGSILSNFTIGYILLIGWFTYLLVIFICARYSMRKKYKIEPVCCSCCGGEDNINPVEDCCCMYWCSCCSAIQMASHTHDGKKYPYNAFNKTGLDVYAPEIIV